jgi:hypothetical protein
VDELCGADSGDIDYVFDRFFGEVLRGGYKWVIGRNRLATTHLYPPQRFAFYGRFGSVFGSGFLEDAGYVVFDCAFGQEKAVGDVGVAESLSDKV